MARVFAFSDLHVDAPENMAHILSLSNYDFVNDTIIIAGDASDSLARLEQLFTGLLKKFSTVCFVPGNHELWIRHNNFNHSIEKFYAVIELCKRLNIKVSPHRVGGQSNVWLVPLFSWYRLPEEGGNTLYIEKKMEDASKVAWADDYFCNWNISLNLVSPADYFLHINTPSLSKSYDAPIISFSHFLPRRELIFDHDWISNKYADGKTAIEPHPMDPLPYFNFSRVAGDQGIEHQIRQLKSIIHVYGHQHRNRDKTIEGVRYISHCLGSRSERPYLSAEDMHPKCIWHD